MSHGKSLTKDTKWRLNGCAAQAAPLRVAGEAEQLVSRDPVAT
jgi:hypothetical protein